MSGTPLGHCVCSRFGDILQDLVRPLLDVATCKIYAKFDEIFTGSGEFLGLPLSLLLSTKTTATKQESNSPNPTHLSINGEFDFLPQTRLELTYGHPRRDWCKVWAQLKGRRKEYSRKKKLKREIEAKNCSLHFITNNIVYNYSITIKSNWIK